MSLPYSVQYGLVSVGGLEGYGFSDTMYKLSFSNTAYREQIYESMEMEANGY